MMLLTVRGTEWPILCWCAAKKLFTHSHNCNNWFHGYLGLLKCFLFALFHFRLSA